MIPSVEADYLLRVIESHIKPLNEKIEELREMINNSKEAIPSEQEKGFWCTYCKSPKSKCICSTKEAIPDRQPSPQITDDMENFNIKAKRDWITRGISTYYDEPERANEYRYMLEGFDMCMELIRQPSPSGGDAIEFGEWIHEQGYEPWGVTGLWHNIANHKIIPDKIFTTEQLYQIKEQEDKP